MRLSVALVLFAGFALLQTGCTTIHDLGIPSAQFDAIRFDHIEVSTGSQEARLDVVLRFLVDNPTGTQLLIPRHEYAVLLGLDGQAESAMTQIHASSQTRTLVPAHGQTPLEYVIPLSLNPVTANRALAYLGHEAVYQFQATVDLGALNPSTGAPTLKHRGHIKLPLPPQIVVDGPPRFEFLGGFEHLDLAGIRNLMQPAVDAITSFGVQNIPFLGPAWTNFLDGFNQIRGGIDYPGPDTAGLKVTVPVRVNNPNHFTIELPAFAAAARIGSTTDPVLDLQLRPGNGTALDRTQRRIGPTSFKRLNAESLVRWKDLPAGLPQLLRPNGLASVQLTGSVSVDLGYGPVRVTFP